MVRTAPLGLRNFLLMPLGIFKPDRIAPRPWIPLHLEESDEEDSD